jgi:hypothetical protein
MKLIKKCLAWLVMTAALALLLFIITEGNMIAGFFVVLLLALMAGIASLIAWAIVTLGE